MGNVAGVTPSLTRLAAAACAGVAALAITTASLPSLLPAAGAVVFGTPAEPAPWAAQIQSFGSPVVAQPCTGVVVAPRWVLTAAHCGPANPATLTVAFGNFAAVPAGITGTGSLATPDQVGAVMAAPGSVSSGSLGRVRPVSALHSPSGDVMLIELSAPAPAAPVMRARVDPARGSILSFYGFGQFVVNSPSSPLLLRGETRLDDMVPRAGSWIGLNQTVRGGYAPGDSGGPLFQGNQLVGIHSGSDHARRNPDGTNPAWYESIPAQNSWIDSVINR